MEYFIYIYIFIYIKLKLRENSMYIIYQSNTTDINNFTIFLQTADMALAFFKQLLVNKM